MSHNSLTYVSASGRLSFYIGLAKFCRLCSDVLHEVQRHFLVGEASSLCPSSKMISGEKGAEGTLRLLWIAFLSGCCVLDKKRRTRIQDIPIKKFGKLPSGRLPELFYNTAAQTLRNQSSFFPLISANDKFSLFTSSGSNS